jgi:hypothetical protein
MFRKRPARAVDAIARLIAILEKFNEKPPHARKEEKKTNKVTADV